MSVRVFLFRAADERFLTQEEEKMKKHWWTAVAVVFMFSGAQASEPQKPKSESATSVLEEVVVSATKTEEKRKDVPNAVVLVDALDIEESPAKSLGELLANEPGIDWRTYGDYGGASELLQIRGMSPNGTQVLVNGVNVASPSLGTADVSKIPLNSIERVEVVKGSGSLLYGSGAMGGTVNIVTKSPKRDRVDLKAGAGYGTQNTLELTAESGMFFYQDFAYYLTLGRRETDGFRDNSGLTHNDASLKLVWDKGDALNLSLYGDIIDREYGRPGVTPPEGTKPFFVGTIPFYNADAANLLAEGSDEDRHFVLNLKSRPYDWLTLSARGDYSKLENFDLDRYVDTDGNLAGTRLWVTNTVRGAEANANVQLFKGGSVLLGVDHKDFDWKNESVNVDAGEGEVPGSRTAFDAGVHTTGYYLEAQYRPCDFFKALAGVRQEKHSTFGSETLPLFGAVINAGERTAFKVSHGRHFLAPTPNDLFWPKQDFGFYSFEGNPNLEPETGWHSDATVEHRFWDDRVFAYLTYFRWDVNDKIQWEPNEKWHYRPINLDRFEGSGWEAGLNIGPYRDMTFSLSYTYTDAEEENAFVTRRATYTPEHQFKGTLTHWTRFGLSTQLTVRYVGDRVYYGSDKALTEPLATLDAYWTVDLRLSQRFFDRWTVSLSANNLLDEAYDTYLNPFYDFSTGKSTLQGFPGAGRSFFAKLTYEF